MRHSPVRERVCSRAQTGASSNNQIKLTSASRFVTAHSTEPTRGRVPLHRPSAYLGRQTDRWVTVAIPPCGTFQYVAVVPESEGDRTSWNVRLCAPVELTGDDLRDDRLVGYSPTLELSDAGITPDVRIPSNGRAHPRVLRNRMTLTAANRSHARVASAAFHLDQAFAMVLSPRDMLFMARTGCGGLGVSIVRDGQLIAAVGAVGSGNSGA